MVINKRDYKLIVIAVILIAVAFGAGFISGAQSAIKTGIKLARGFVEIDIREDLIQQAINQYNNNIGSCYPPLPLK